MKHKLMKQGVIAVAAFALVLQPGGYIGHSSISGGVVAAAQASLSSKIVNLGASSSLFVRDARLLMQEEGLLLAYTVTITNNGTSELDIMNYWLRVKGKGGKTFTTSVAAEDKTKTKVAPGSSVNLTYYSTVDSSTTISDISFDVIKWDFSVASYERVLGTIKVPSDSSVTTQPFQPSVMIFNNTKIKGALKQYYVTEDKDGLYATISFLVENVGYSSANLGNLGFALQTASYSVFDVTATGLEQTSLQPKERKIITMQAKLPVAVKGKTVNLVPYTKNAESEIKLPNGSYAIPALVPAAPAEAGKPRIIYLDGKRVETVTGNAVMNQNDGETEVNMEFTLENVDTAAVALSELKFTLRTQDGVSYPMNYEVEQNVSLLPNIEKNLYLSGKIPDTVDRDTTQLVVETQGAEGQSGYVIGVYKVQSGGQVGNVGSSYVYNKDYQVQLNAIQRAPLSNEDVLVANVTIRNISAVSKATPSRLSGYFLINGVRVEAESTAAGLDQSINIAPNGAYEMAVYTKVPYTTTVDNISFVLTERGASEEASARTLYQYSSQRLSSIPVYSSANAYEVQSAGSRTSVEVRKTNIYQDGSNRYFYAEFVVQNLEERAARLVDLGGYIQDDSGAMAPIQLAELDSTVMANGTVLMSAWGEIGKSFNTDNFRLVFGQAIKTVPTEQGAQPETIVVKPVSYSVIGQEVATKSDFNEIEVGGYKLTLRDIWTQLNVAGQFNVTGLKTELEYDLSQDEQYDYIAGDHKIMFEFVNDDALKATYSQVLALENAAEGETALEEGDNIPLTLVFPDDDIQSEVQKYDKYRLNIYDVFGEAKVLVASKELTWNRVE